MDLKALAQKISAKIKKEPDDYRAYDDYFNVCKGIMKGNRRMGIAGLKWLSGVISEALGGKVSDSIDFMRNMMLLHRQVLLVLAPIDFDSYLQYVEWEREPEKKFYIPRRKQLKVVVDALQDLADDKLDLLAISMPPGTGKSTLAIFFLTWLAGKYPDKPMLIGSHSNSWTRGAYALGSLDLCR